MSTSAVEKFAFGGNGQQTVTASSAALPSIKGPNDRAKLLYLVAHAGNAGAVYWGKGTVATSDGVELAAGNTSPPIPVDDDISEVEVIGPGGGEKVSYYYLK